MGYEWVIPHCIFFGKNQQKYSLFADANDPDTGDTAVLVQN